MSAPPPPPPPPPQVPTAVLDGDKWSWDDIKAATQSFSAHLRLGEGGFGIVYRGRRAGKDVAIKALKTDVYNEATPAQKRQIESIFKAEIQTLNKLQHPNLAELVGWCQEGGGRWALVYELMEGGSLDQRMSDMMDGRQR